jgi:putative endonuclease
MTVKRQHLGKSGEDLAVDEIVARGYAVLARRYRTRGGEIDIVAEDGGTVVFVEVKARTSADFGSAVEAVTPRKQRQLVVMARDYLARARLLDRPCRFDIVAIDDVDTVPRITIYRNAFGDK